MEKPLVSILIPVYNREEVVRRALDSAISQTYTNLEIIVCDNASTDNTMRTLEEYAAKDNRIQIYRNETNVGPVRNWKCCLDHAIGKYAKFLWSDDEILPTFIEIMVNALESNDECGFAYSDVKIVGSKQCWCGVYNYGKSGYYDSDGFVEASLCETKSVPVSPGCALFRTDDLKKNLQINIKNQHNIDFSKYGAGNDIYIFLYSCKNYHLFYFLDNVLSVFYAGADSISVSKEEHIKFCYEIAKMKFVHDNILYRKFRYRYYCYLVYFSEIDVKKLNLCWFKKYIKTKRYIKHFFKR